jgi:hypothetical protein
MEMAFRSETKAGARMIARLILVWATVASPLFAQTYNVRHRHLRQGGEGVLTIGETFLSFEEAGKQARHSRRWGYDDIQELVLAPDTLRVVTYEDQRWELGRDRVYVFDRLPAELAGNTYPMLAKRLDQRFVAALADERVVPAWQTPAKLAHGREGSHGLLLFGSDQVVYKSTGPGESRTWRITDLENVSSSDRFDLTIATHERDFRFQLKQPLPEIPFRQLWRRVNLAKGLQILTSNNPTGDLQ